MRALRGLLSCRELAPARACRQPSDLLPNRRTGNGIVDEIVTWLHKWQALINSGDLEKAKPLFADDVIAFGSLTAVMSGKADLVEQQWSSLWPRIKDFTFGYDSLHTFADEARRVVTAAMLWRSLGRRRDGSWYERRGRATLVLRRESDGYVCVHSHFSMEPGIPPVDG